MPPDPLEDSGLCHYLSPSPPPRVMPHKNINTGLDHHKVNGLCVSISLQALLENDHNGFVKCVFWVFDDM